MKISQFHITFSLTCILIFLVGCQGDEGVRFLERKSFDGDLPSEYVNDQTNVQMETEKSIYSKSINEIKITVSNQGPNPIAFGTYYRVEKYQENAWYEVPLNIQFTDIGLSIKTNETYNDEVQIEHLDYQLTQGLYRIVKEFRTENDDFRIAAKFTID
ncbi:immunoglobulin-like domain-containing protein [Alkalibacillus haloalkaliphilus]|uniref:immunoglobulin-like domain-containing protein n=1 Tax=Alkalibacillus haloalkaliphilus TaxID=94136 RepID=UPI00293597F0|nr:immunoglobulin-like domain-containing protein [Alkalibacillus haloalkaliphilus]MDV2582582.1 immunoglobulin-like domain-containing protein [Alkalibacillus haloalkaliphilus]